MCLILTSTQAGLVQAQAPIPEEQSHPQLSQELLEDYEELRLRHREDTPKQEREFIPPTEESLKRTQEQVQSYDCATVTDVPAIECEALVALYDSTNGAGWKDNTNWLSTNTVGNWKGVTNNGGHVVDLRLGANKLIGVLPSQLGNLSKVKELHLHHNQLSGSIPSSIGNLKELGFFILITTY